MKRTTGKWESTIIDKRFWIIQTIAIRDNLYNEREQMSRKPIPADCHEAQKVYDQYRYLTMRINMAEAGIRQRIRNLINQDEGKNIRTLFDYEKSLKMFDRFSKNHPTLGHPRRIKINRYNDNERVCI